MVCTPGEVSASGKPTLRAHLEPAAPVPIGPLVAFAGIGRPERFFDSLKAQGADLRDAVPYDDHHPYSSGDLQFLRRLASAENARLVTTAKDHVRLSPEMRAETLVHPVKAVFEAPEALDALLAPLFKHT